mmetsp:Transcript_39089/g.62424  ORF Transcript_39089/g.62424 Transcript_39089/m.62424 type:complete len:336 (-) Transcript_39089:100-1107(-)
MAELDTATNAEEKKPLTEGGDNQMVDIVLDKPRNPPQYNTAQQQTEIKQQATDIPQSDAPRQQQKDWKNEVAIAGNKCYNWFPLGVFAWLSGWLLIACGIGDLVVMKTNFIEFWMYVYLLVGALVILVVDMPLSLNNTLKFVVKLQLVIFDWVKLFRRIWGRCVLYLIMMVTCGSFLANDDDPSDFRSVPWIAGLYLLVIIVLSLIFSWLAAKKYNVVRQYIIEATVIERDLEQEDDAEVRQMSNVSQMIDARKSEVDEEIVMKKLISKFDQLDVAKSGKLQMNEIAQLGEECGNAFSAAEKYAIFLLLDKESNGVITKPEWILQLKKHKNCKML